MTTINLPTLCLDASRAGKLAGQHQRMAALDLDASEDFAAISGRLGGAKTPEAVVRDYFSAKYCDPRKESFRLKTPLVDCVPPTGLTLLERARRESARWWAAMGEDYLPVPLSAEPGEAGVRARIRCVQLKPFPALQKQYAEAFQLNETPNT